MGYTQIEIPVAVVNSSLTASSVPITMTVAILITVYCYVCTFGMYYVIAVTYLWGAGCGLVITVTCCHGHTLDCIRNRKGCVSVRD